MGMMIAGSSSRRHRRHRVMSEINVTPLVDVMLVLLIIFMVAAPMLATGVKVDLPDSQAQALPMDEKPLSVSIDQEGQLYIEEYPVAIEELGPRLRAISGQNNELRIYVRGDQGIAYGQVMRVMGEINRAGFNKVGLVTEPWRDR